MKGGKIMRFYIEFIAGSDDYVIDVDERRIGFKDIEQAQRFCGQEAIIEKVHEFVYSWRAKLCTLEISKKLAWHLYQSRKLFEHTNVVQVTVPAESLNKYVIVSFDFEYNEDGVEVYPVYQVNDEQLLNDWIDADYPLVWRITKQQGGEKQ
jgi:hypothetical protein